MLTNRILCYWVPNKIPIRLEGLHTGLQLQAVQARPVGSHARIGP
jgi:hypothetical protein